jgi:hypothetical protein
MNMKNIFKIYLLSFFLLSDFIAFAQDDEPENPDPEPLPINSKLVWLALFGILFILYKRKELTKLSKTK